MPIQPRPLTGIQPRPITSKITPRPISSVADILDNISQEDKDAVKIAQVNGALDGEDPELLKAKAIMDPKLFCKIFLGAKIWETQAAILDAIASKPNARVAVKACHASSKTFSAAILTLWFLARYTDAIVITTAPTWHQVEKLLWGEIHAALQRTMYPFPKANQTELRFGPKRYAAGLSTAVTKQDEGVRFQGIHAENVLFILDEAPGVNPKIWEAIEGGRAGGNVRVLAIGNPTISSGPFHKAFVDNRSGWIPFTIDAFETPNLKGITLEQLVSDDFPDDELDNNPYPFLVTRRWVREQYFEYGVDNPFWESRVRGQFPKQSPDSLISLAWLEDAQRRELPAEGDCSAGLDVAGPGEDETSLTIRIGKKIVFHRQWPISDPRGEVVQSLNNYRGILKAVNVDIVGVGWYLYKHLEDLKFPVKPVVVQSAPRDSEKFYDLKTEWFWGLRKRLQDGDIAGLMDEKTIGQLAGIRYSTTSRGQLKVESKDDARKRGVRSPDRAESVMLAFGSNTSLFGALEFYKNEMQKVQSSQIVKLVTTDDQLSCPNCQAICIVKASGQWRCGQCGTQWYDKDELKKPFVVSRRDMLKKRFS